MTLMRAATPPMETPKRAEAAAAVGKSVTRKPGWKKGQNKLIMMPQQTTSSSKEAEVESLIFLLNEFIFVNLVLIQTLHLGLKSTSSGRDEYRMVNCLGRGDNGRYVCLRNVNP